MHLRTYIWPYVHSLARPPGRVGILADVNVNKLYIYIANPRAISLGENKRLRPVATEGSHMGYPGSRGWLGWLETSGFQALVQQIPEDSSDVGHLGKTAGNSSDQSCTFARSVLRLQEGNHTARGQLPYCGCHPAREAVRGGVEVSPDKPGPTQPCFPSSSSTQTHWGCSL